ncbi:hypothetical protein ES703_53888 [subsurface metagenome]
MIIIYGVLAMGEMNFQDLKCFYQDHLFKFLMPFWMLSRLAYAFKGYVAEAACRQGEE